MISDDLLALISKKELEISKLEKEIRDLKSKYNELNIIKHNYTKDEKIKIFMEYFRGRYDVYPYLSIDKQDTNKKYYIPKCKNEWNKSILMIIFCKQEICF